jgi:hypothetical protein
VFPRRRAQTRGVVSFRWYFYPTFIPAYTNPAAASMQA